MIVLTQAGILPGGHIAGVPIEEMLASLGPVLLVAGGAVLLTLRARLRRVRHARPERTLIDPRGAAGARDDSAMRTMR